MMFWKFSLSSDWQSMTYVLLLEALVMSEVFTKDNHTGLFHWFPREIFAIRNTLDEIKLPIKINS